MVLLSSHHRVSKRHPVIKSQHFGFIVLISVLILALLLLSGCKRSVTTPQASQGTPSGQGSDSGTTSGSNSGSGTGSGGGSGSGSGSGTGSGGGTGTGSTSGPGSGKSSGSGTASGSSEYSFAVYLDGTKLKDFSLKDVLALPQTSVTVDGKEQKGPKLKEVLKAAGITEYSKVKVFGAWQETYTLDKSAVDDTVVLDTANRGTCKLAGPSIPKDKWVRDVTRIEVTR